MKREMVFERKKALKRNVATRQPARFVGQVLNDVFDLRLKLLLVATRVSQIQRQIRRLPYRRNLLQNKNAFSNCLVQARLSNRCALDRWQTR